MNHQLDVEWIDGGREPQCAADPNYPNGVVIDITKGGTPFCETALSPYPTPRCGWFFVRCRGCGQTALITTAGRVDDPRRVRLPCQELVQ